MISTKGRYALRVMIDLAEHGGERPVPLKDFWSISSRDSGSVMLVRSLQFSKAD